MVKITKKSDVSINLNKIDSSNLSNKQKINYMDSINQQRYMSMMISQLEGVKGNINEFNLQTEMLVEEDENTNSFPNINQRASSRTTLKNDVKNL